MGLHDPSSVIICYLGKGVSTLLNIGQWLWYGLQLPGCPLSTKVDSADIILAQAFGRNTLVDSDLANLRLYRDQRGEAATLAWCRLRVEPGMPNRSLAMQLMHFMHQTGRPAIVQWEILVACPAAWYEHHQSRIGIVWPSQVPGAVLTTRDVLHTSLVLADIRQWQRTRALVLAHRRHAMRVAMMYRRMTGRWPVVPEELPDDFDCNSVQWWTKHPLAWTFYEFLARGHHLVHHWV